MAGSGNFSVAKCRAGLGLAGGRSGDSFVDPPELVVGILPFPTEGRQEPLGVVASHDGMAFSIAGLLDDRLR